MVKTKKLFLFSLLMLFCTTVWGQNEGGTTTYTLTASSVEHGSISFKDASGNVITSAAEGTEVTIVVSPEKDYALKSLNYSYEGTTTKFTVPAQQYSFTMPAHNVAVTATFAQLYNITGTTAGNGNISFTDANGTPITQAVSGTKVTVVVAPNTDNGLSTLSCSKDNNESVEISYSDGQYSFTMPNSAVTVNATFTALYTISAASSITNGSISFVDVNGTSITRAVSGATIRVIVSPDIYYELGTLSVNQTSITNNSFTMPNENVEVNATFTQVPLDRMIFYTTSNNTSLGPTSDGTIGMWGLNNNIMVSLISDMYDNTKQRGVLTFNYPVKSIGVWAGESSPFKGKTAINTMTIPSSVTTIGGHAFNACTNLTTIGAHNSKDIKNDLSNVLFFTQYAFNGCSSLTTHILNPGIRYIGIDAFNGCSSMNNALVFEYDNLKIQDFSFLKSGITSVEFKGQNISVALEAFEWCESLNSVKTTGDGSLSSIAAKAFKNSSTTEVDLNVTGSIGDEAFLDNKNLTSVTIRGCTSIGKQAFENASNLGHVNITGSTSIGENAFHNSFQNNSDLDKIVSLNGCTSVGDNAFLHCTYLSDVTIDGNSCTIGNNAFKECPNMLTATIKGCTSIGDNAFYGLDNLQTVKIEGSTSIGEYAFESCDVLENVTLGNCTKIKRGAFSMNTKITSIVIPGSCKSIGHSAFYGTGLTKLTLNEGLESIGEQAFASGLHIANLVIPASVTSIGSTAFSTCTDIKTVVFQNRQDQTGQNIGSAAFSGCTSLKYVVLPKNISSLEYNVFNGCSSLEKIFFINPSCPILVTNEVEDLSQTPSVITLYTPFSGLPQNPDIYVPVGSKNHYKKKFADVGVIKTEGGDVQSDNVLGWDIFMPNSSGWGTYGGTCSEGDDDGKATETLVEHRWDFQSYKELLGDLSRLGLNDISELNLYYSDDWTSYTDEKSGTVTKTVLFKKMQPFNSTSEGTTSQNMLHLRQGDGLLYCVANGTGDLTGKKYAILEAHNTQGSSYTENTNLMKAGANVAPRYNGGAGFFYVYTSKNNIRGFYRLASNVVVPAGKAYLDLSKLFFGSSNVKENILIEGIEDEPTGITELFDDSLNGNLNYEKSGVMYNLSGQQITEPHGVYIMNGKKYFAK